MLPCSQRRILKKFGEHNINIVKLLRFTVGRAKLDQFRLVSNNSIANEVVELNSADLCCHAHERSFLNGNQHPLTNIAISAESQLLCETWVA